MREALLIAHLDAAEVQHAVLHRAVDPLAAARLLRWNSAVDDAEREVQARAGVTDLRAGHKRQAVAEARRRRRAASALRDVFVNLAVLDRDPDRSP